METTVKTILYKGNSGVTIQGIMKKDKTYRPEVLSVVLQTRRHDAAAAFHLSILSH